MGLSSEPSQRFLRVLGNTRLSKFYLCLRIVQLQLASSPDSIDNCARRRSHLPRRLATLAPSMRNRGVMPSESSRETLIRDYADKSELDSGG